MAEAGIVTDKVSPILLPRYTHGNPKYEAKDVYKRQEPWTSRALQTNRFLRRWMRYVADKR